MYNRVNKLGLSCAKLSSNWVQLSQLRMAKVRGGLKNKLGTSGTGTRTKTRDPRDLNYRYLLKYRIHLLIHLEICQNIVFTYLFI